MDIQRRLRDPFDGDDRPVDRPGTDADSETEPGLVGALVDISSSNMVGAHQRVVEPLEEPTTSASFVHDAAPESEWLLARVESPKAAAGLMGTTGRVYSPDGRLLASGGAQLFCVPEPAA